MKTKNQKKLNCGPIPSNPRDIGEWTKEQIRAAGPWSKHEVESTYDELCAPYDWVPDWIGDMSPLEVNRMIADYYDTIDLANAYLDHHR